MRSRHLILAPIALLLLSVSASASGNITDAVKGVATRSLSLPGVELRVMLITPETYWSDLRGQLGDDQAATREFQASWPQEQAKGLRFEVAVKSEGSPLTVDWRAARLQIGDGPSLEPSAVRFPEPTKPGEWAKGNLWFTAELPSPSGKLSLAVPALGAATNPGWMAWELPLGFPEEVGAAISPAPRSDAEPATAGGG